MRVIRRFGALVAVVISCTLMASGCGGSSSAGENSITLYNAQHQDLMQLMVDGFTKSTGIKVNMRNGSDFELANQIIQEGSSSPADVFATENSPAMSMVDSKNGFAFVGDQAVGNVPSAFVPASKNWAGFAARSTVLAYNPQTLAETDLPKSILDLADPKWKGRVGIAANGADFQAIVSAVLAVNGQDATEKWLKGLKDNAKIYQGNVPVMKAVNAGEIDSGIIYHYYWYKDQAESGANSENVKLQYFGNKDAGAFVSTSGAGVVKTSKKVDHAREFVAFLNGPEGQRILAESKALEYAVGNNASSNAKLKPLAELDPPTIEVGSLNGPLVVEMMQKAALL
jgi:iron(III) transport system substrate-binding protein